jgi:hypothetical protein
MLQKLQHKISEDSKEGGGKEGRNNTIGMNEWILEERLCCWQGKARQGITD